MMGVINKQIMPQIEDNWRGTLNFTDPKMVIGHLASYNEYHPFVEKGFTLQLACAGIDTR